VKFYTNGVYNFNIKSLQSRNFPEAEFPRLWLSAFAGITASASTPCLLKIEPGIYDLAAASLNMKPYVDVEGAGENTTILTGNVSSLYHPLYTPNPQKTCSPQSRYHLTRCRLRSPRLIQFASIIPAPSPSPVIPSAVTRHQSAVRILTGLLCLLPLDASRGFVRLVCVNLTYWR
jgi:hypothetical protein